MAWITNGMPAKMNAPTTSRMMYMALLPTVIWFGGMKLTRKAAAGQEAEAAYNPHAEGFTAGNAEGRGVFGSL